MKEEYGMKEHWRKGMKRVSDVAYWLLLVAMGMGMLYMVATVFWVAKFKIPSDSMEPALLEGDYLLVEKLTMGARLFDLKPAFAKEEFDIYRMPALGKVERNDILVFNYPFPTRKDSIAFDVMLYYVKRCIALPGDTLEIRNAHYLINGKDSGGNIEAQERLERLFREKRTKEYGIVTRSYPRDRKVGWSIREMGPLYLPRKGDRLPMNRMNYLLYYPLIEWETGKDLVWVNDSLVTSGGERLETYRFENNYYFVSGDKMENSKDSRYWGLLPEPYIVGRAWLIWKSVDEWGNMRWDRIGRIEKMGLE